MTSAEGLDLEDMDDLFESSSTIAPVPHRESGSRLNADTEESCQKGELGLPPLHLTMTTREHGREHVERVK